MQGESKACCVAQRQVQEELQASVGAQGQLQEELTASFGAQAQVQGESKACCSAQGHVQGELKVGLGTQGQVPLVPHAEAGARGTQAQVQGQLRGIAARKAKCKGHGGQAQGELIVRCMLCSWPCVGLGAHWAAAAGQVGGAKFSLPPRPPPPSTEIERAIFTSEHSCSN